MLAFGVGTGSAFASEEANPAPSPTVTTELSTEVAISESTEKTPSLLPGDFFYFIKVVYEKIQLSITTDDVKEAKLLAGFAQERLSEAAALHAQGDTEKSEQVLQKSFENQQLAIELVDSKADEDNEEKDLEQAVEVKSDLQHNIIALTAALEKVKNPQAQQSLLKNIIKSFGHLEKKLAKLESKAQVEQASETSTDQETAPAVAPADANTDIVVSSDTDATTSIETETEEETVVDKKTKPVKEAKIEKEEKIKKVKIEKEVKIDKEIKIEKEVKIDNDATLNKQKNDNKNNHNNNNEKNHNSK